MAVTELVENLKELRLAFTASFSVQLKISYKAYGREKDFRFKFYIILKKPDFKMNLPLKLLSGILGFVQFD